MTDGRLAALPQFLMMWHRAHRGLREWNYRNDGVAGPQVLVTCSDDTVFRLLSGEASSVMSQALAIVERAFADVHDRRLV